MIAELPASHTGIPTRRAQGSLLPFEITTAISSLGIALVLVIALVAGVAGGAMVSRSPLQSVSPGSARDSETAHAFYTAFDRALAGGGTESLAALLAPGFLDHDASLGEARTADEFLAQIGALGQTGGSRLTVDSISASGRNLIVEIRQTPAWPLAFAGVAIEQAGDQPIVEELRVAQGRIIDRWTPGAWWLQASESDELVWFGADSVGYVGTLVRVTIPDTTRYHWAATGPGFLTIESGSARMQVTRSQAKAETQTVVAGDGIALASGELVDLRPVDGSPVTATIYALVRGAGADFLLAASGSNAHKAGVSQSVLWKGPMVDAQGGTVHRLGTLQLPAGKEVRLTGTGGASLLVNVDSGAIAVDAQDGLVFALNVNLVPVEKPNVTSVEAGRAVSVNGASAITLHNSTNQPVSLTVIVAEPVEPGGPTLG